MKKLKTSLMSLLILFSFLAATPSQVLAASTTKEDICAGVALTGGDCSDGGGVSVESIIGTVINVISFIVGVIAVIMIIIGGLRYITSGGDSNNTKGAKDTILYAIIGLVVVAMAQIIVRFVIKKV